MIQARQRYSRRPGQHCEAWLFSVFTQALACSASAGGAVCPNSPELLHGSSVIGDHSGAIHTEGRPMLPNLKVWLSHFEYHAEHPRRMPEGIPDTLSALERRLIAASIATFQLGEQSSG